MASCRAYLKIGGGCVFFNRFSRVFMKIFQLKKYEKIVSFQALMG